MSQSEDLKMLETAATEHPDTISVVGAMAREIRRTTARLSTLEAVVDVAQVRAHNRLVEQVEEIYSDTVAALKASSEAKEAPMRARLLVLHRKEIYPGEFGPEIMAVADEYTLDQNSEWWENEVARQKSLVADEASAWAEVDIEISADALMRALYPGRKSLAVEVVGEEGS